MYDAVVHSYLLGAFQRAPGESSLGSCGDSVFTVSSEGKVTYPATAPMIDSEAFSIETFQGALPGSAQWSISKSANLRYGENPHQIAALYKTALQQRHC